MEPRYRMSPNELLFHWTSYAMKRKITSIDSYRIQFANQGVERSWLTPRCLFSTLVSWLYVKVICGLRALVIDLAFLEIWRSWSSFMRIWKALHLCRRRRRCCCHSLQSFFFDNPSFNNDFCSGRSCGKRSGQTYFFQPKLPRELWVVNRWGLLPRKTCEYIRLLVPRNSGRWIVEMLTNWYTPVI